jgi:hypothetical protein
MCTLKNVKCPTCEAIIREWIPNWKVAGFYNLSYPKELPVNMIAVRHEMNKWFANLIEYIKFRIAAYANTQDGYVKSLEYNKKIILGSCSVVKRNLLFTPELFSWEKFPLIKELIVKIPYTRTVNDKYVITLEMMDEDNIGIILSNAPKLSNAHRQPCIIV